MNGIDATLIVLALTLAAAGIARKLRTPSPVVTATAGIAIGVAWRFVPGLPFVRIPPEHVLFIFLPPLLTAASYSLPLGALRRSALPVTLLAVGLVLATMAAVAAAAHAVAGLSWAAAFVLGTIVAPPDPIAATAIAGRMGIRHRLVVILEGEGLVNDAVAIVAYHLAVNAAVSGQFHWTDAAVAVALEAPVGVLVGLVVGWIVTRLRERLNDATLEAGISLLAPYATYEIAERAGASAVLAVVTLGLVLQVRRTQIASPAVRLATQTVWNAVEFATSALVFFLLGLLIGEVVVDVGINARLTLTGAAVTGVAIVLRLVWVHTALPVVHGPRIGGRPLASRHELTVIGWAGMRGVVSLALALALPLLTSRGASAGDPRGVIILLTFAVIVGTLIVQGYTLVPLIRWLGVGDESREVADERRTRARARRAALALLARLEHGEASDDACREIADRVASGEIGIASANATGGPLAADAGEVARVLELQRSIVSRMRDAGRLGSRLARRLETEIDVDAARLGTDGVVE